jgi:hypothetical protein
VFGLSLHCGNTSVASILLWARRGKREEKNNGEKTRREEKRKRKIFSSLNIHMRFPLWRQHQLWAWFFWHLCSQYPLYSRFPHLSFPLTHSLSPLIPSLTSDSISPLIPSHLSPLIPSHLSFPLTTCHSLPSQSLLIPFTPIPLSSRPSPQ